MSTSVQLIGPNGQDKGDTVKLYVGRLSLATYTHPVQFLGGVATVSDQDLSALRAMGVVRVLS